MKIRKFTDAGSALYVDWLKNRTTGQPPPSVLMDDEHSQPCLDIEIDESRVFQNRFEFGKYIAGVLAEQSFRTMLDQDHDSMWDWITVAYFSQFGKKPIKYWYFAVTRDGLKGSLAYRHLARTSYEMYVQHGDSSIVVLSAAMDTGGELMEALTSRQNIAYHKAAFAAAAALYWNAGKIRKGAGSKAKKPKERKPGETAGRASARRLALALRRLALTYDTHIVEPTKMIQLLPREFANFVARANAQKVL